MRLLVLLLLFVNFNSFAVECSKHPIYCKIVKLVPNIDKDFAMNISNVFHKYGKKYQLDPNISVAIAMQETGLKRKSRTGKVIVYSQDMQSFEIVEGYTDICMFQFHVDTIKAEDLDPIKLKLDFNYCAEQHFKLLKKKISLCRERKIKPYWSCYHSVTPEFRELYTKQVNRFL